MSLIPGKRYEWPKSNIPADGVSTPFTKAFNVTVYVLFTYSAFTVVSPVMLL